MLEIMPETKGDTLVLRASERLTAPDYEQVFIPALETVIGRHGKARLLLFLDEGFRGWEPVALRDEAAFGLRHRNDFEKIALVGGPAWAGWGARLGNVFLEAPVRTFGPGELAEALAWVGDFPDTGGDCDGQPEYELDEDALILTVRPKGRLQKEFFRAVRKRIDPVIEAKGDLNGVIIAAASFPWWESPAALIAHLRFVRDHHRSVRKVALVSDDEFARLLSRLAARFVVAEIRRFDGEDAALQWIKERD